MTFLFYLVLVLFGAYIMGFIMEISAKHGPCSGCGMCKCHNLVCGVDDSEWENLRKESDEKGGFNAQDNT